MRHLVVFIALITTIVMTSLASMIENQRRLAFVARPRTAIQNVPVRVSIPKFKLLRTNPYRKSLIADGETTDVEDDNIAPGYRRRRELVKLHADDELSDYVVVRLAVARAKAMEAYRKKWQT